MIINDEAHHIHDESLAWFKSIQDIHNRLKAKGTKLALQVDMTATPKKNDGSIFVQTISDYPLVEAIHQRIVKNPVVPDEASCGKLKENQSSLFSEKYRDYIIELDVASMLDAFHDISDLEKGFEIAIKQEVATQKLYAALIERTASLSLKRLLKQLQEEENKHERLLLREHGKLFHPDQVEEDGEDEI